MGGGAKKKSITKMEKQQIVRERYLKGTQKKSTAVAAKKIGSVEMPNLSDKKFLDDILAMKVLTPYSVSSKYGVRLSIAKDLLEWLSAHKLVEPVATSSRIKIYRPIHD